MTFPFHEAARQHAEKIAFDDGVNRIAYGELDRTIAQSKVMQISDLSPGDHVAWRPRNDLDAFLTFWAILKRRCVACPLSHRFPEVKRNELLDRIDAKWLPDLLAERDDQTKEDQVDSASSPIWDDSSSPATLILSSGSTGNPKAIVHSISAHVQSAIGAAVNMPLGAGDRWLWSLPLYHISGLSILVRCAVAGATVVGLSAQAKPSVRLLEQLGVTHLSVVSTQLRRLMDDESFRDSKLRYVLLGGSCVDSDLVARARSQGISVSTTYGLTEMASQVTTSDAAADPNTSGKLLPGREMKIESGEIFVRGPMLCLGYYRDGQIESVVDEAGWFGTGDLGQLDEDQQLNVIGRMDNMFISGGENIYPENIERAMLAAFEIRRVVVVPKPDEQFGFRPVAFVDGSLPDLWEDELRQGLSGFEIPVSILPWPLKDDESLKVDRKHLKSLV